MTDGSGPLLDGQIMAPSPLIKEGSLDTFTADVIEASMEAPVLVDFWMPGSPACVEMMATLEKLVGAAGGKVKLVKFNAAENQELAQQLRVQSVPTVFAFKGGQPVDGFSGALPEAQVRAFIEKQTGALGPSPAEQFLTQAQAASEAGDLARAEQAFGAVVHEDPGNTAALAGLTKTYIALGDLPRAAQALQMLPPGTKDDAELTGARAALELAEQAANVDTSALEALRAAVANKPKDMEAKLALVDALLAVGEREQGVDLLLDMIEIDRTWNDAEARKKLLTLFEAFGPTDELTLSARRRLSSILFS